METQIFDLLHRGYFPKELPNSFNTFFFALNYEEIEKRWNVVRTNTKKYFVKHSAVEEEGEKIVYDKFIKRFTKPITIPTHYSFSKGIYGRRMLSIINPINFLDLALFINKSLKDIISFTDTSKFTQSKPTYNKDIKSRCYVASSKSFSDLINKKLECGMNKQIELKLDIDRFYESIYTHSITWALIGKEKAKEIWREHGNNIISKPINNEEKLFNLGQNLDHLIEVCQDSQTHGIPTGPDSSFIIAEIITTYIDNEIYKINPNLKGCRYYDDYTFYLSKEEEVNKIIDSLQHTLGTLGLNINESKVEISKSFKPILEDYKEEIVNAKLQNKDVNIVLISYFNILWRLCNLRPQKTSTILKYGLKALLNTNFKINDPKSIQLFEDLLYKTCLLEPTSTTYISDLLEKEHISPSKDKLSSLCQSIINLNAPLYHDYEVSWGIWLCKIYDLELKLENADIILEMKSPVCTLLLLDYLNNNTNGKKLKDEHIIKSHIEKIESDATESSLFNEDWLLIYEGTLHGWLKCKSIVSNNPYFDFLLNKKISFYDSNNKANYRNYDYIESLPIDIYSVDMKKDAKALKKDIMKRAYDEIFKELNDMPYPDDEIKKMQTFVKEYSKDIDLEKNIFNDILSDLFHREYVDTESYTEYVCKTLLEAALY